MSVILFSEEAAKRRQACEPQAYAVWPRRALDTAAGLILLALVQIIAGVMW